MAIYYDKGRSVRWCAQQFTEADMIEYGCRYSQCNTCGHNTHIAEFRKRQIERNGLTQGEDGLWRYIIPKKGKPRANAKQES